MTKPGWTQEYEVELPAGPERVWRALTEPAELTRWFAEGVEVEPMPGGKFRFWGRRTYGAPPREKAHQRITRFEPGREIAFEWEIDGVESEVVLVLALEPAGGSSSSENAGNSRSERTRLRLRHKFPAPPAVPHATELIDDLWRLTLGNLDAYLRERLKGSVLNS